jgi:uncharacterized radical SAM protein YgiQ
MPAPRFDFLPTSPEEIRDRGWTQPDIIFVSGDAYIDHPSFAAAILGRCLEARGYKVAILAQPDWRSVEAFRSMGPPRLFFAVSAGNMDSMINHYTANKKRRNSDAYSPGGQIELRPDRASEVYAQRCREAFKGIPVVTGGVESSLRRIAHYDYWSDKVRPTNLIHTKADLLAFGMGEHTIIEIADRLNAGENIKNLRDMRGVAYLLGRGESLPEHTWTDAQNPAEHVELPTFEEVSADPMAFARMTRLFHRETNPLNGRRLTQRHGDRLLVVNPPPLSLDQGQMDALYDLPYTRQAHPRYQRATIPAWTMIKDSVQIMRGCFGGCTFCSITMHQGRAVQSRSHTSIINEVKHIASQDGFSGHISDLGGPTANMYRMHCKDPMVEKSCRRLSCVHPTVCSMLNTDHGPLVALMRDARSVPGVKKVHIASGVRMDLAHEQTEYMNDLVEHHVGGYLKVAPEHASDRVLKVMKKPSVKHFERFSAAFRKASQRLGRDQYLIPYFISSHPGSEIEDMIEVAVFLKKAGYAPRQVQDFIPAPMDIATCIYHTGIDPSTMQPVYTARKLKDRDTQRALLQFFKPENYFLVKEALLKANRPDLIGSGPDCLIAERPPAQAVKERLARREASYQPPSAERPNAPKPQHAGYRRASREGGLAAAHRRASKNPQPR